MKPSPEPEDVLAAHADWLAAGGPPATVPAAAQEPDAELAELMSLAAAVQAALPPARPDPTLRSALRQRLVATASRGQLGWRSLSRVPRPSVRPRRPSWQRPQRVLRSGAALALASIILLLLWGRGGRPPL